MATIEAVFKWHQRTMPTKDIKRVKHDCISHIQSHLRRTTSTETQKHSPSAVGSCPSEEQPKLLEGLPHDMHYRAIIGRRDQWREAQTKKADNIEIPAKDNNITGGNSMDVLSNKLKNYLLSLAINQVLKPNGTEFETRCIKIT